jgi:hypothetical protein
MPLIRDFIAEHEQALDCADDILRALDRRDWLIAEHRELAQLLASVDVSTADGEQAVRVAFDELRGHIRREEDGLFPASLTALAGDDWDAAMKAWRDAHPGEDLISR